jgi:CheY-like chemotaxis protein
VACSCATAALPDIILMEIQMPDMNGIKATRRILACQPGPKTVQNMDKTTVLN